MSTYIKAVLAGLVAVGSSLVTALGDNTISLQEGITAMIAGLLALGVVYQVPNKSKGV